MSDVMAEHGVMYIRYVGVFSVVIATRALGGVFSYEGNSFPENGGWNVSQIVCEPELSVRDGWFIVHVELCDGFPPPGGQSASYTRPLDDFIGEEEFFVEWRMETDGERSEIPWGGPSNFSAASFGPVNYAFSIAGDRAELDRVFGHSAVSVDIEPGVPHTHRLELYGDALYIWYLDGQVVDSGIPDAAYPAFKPFIVWRAKAAFLQNTTKWDYIRYGTIPTDGSGDFNSDGQVDGGDFYYFDECFLGSDVDAGPGCRFADFDADTDVDCDDWTAFTQAWTAPDDPPDFPQCAPPPPSIPTASNWASTLLTLILLTAGTTALSRRTPCSA